MGSLNIDYVYRVPHFVQPGETIPSYGREIFAGGKGLNQSIALARAGAQVIHGGMIGPDGAFLKELFGRFWCGYHTYMYTTGSEWSYGDPGR